ncbi:MAG: GAF domain-containing protein [Thermoflexales bacterium]|nr:GAF domain-containing protein [Thermoflexales bacterium]
MNDRLNILLVDDNVDDRALITRELCRDLPDLQAEQVKSINSAQELEQALESPPALVITECHLSWSDGLAVLRAVKARRPECPVIMFTGSGSEEIAVKAVKAGMDDYISKLPKHFARLQKAAWQAMEQARQRQLRAEAHEWKQTAARPEVEQVHTLAVDALQASEARYRALAEAAHDMIFIIDRQGRVEYVNSFAAQQFGREPEQFIGQSIAALFPFQTAERQTRSIRSVFETGEPVYIETATPFPGQELWLSTWLAPIKDQNSEVSAVLGVSRDITSRVQAEKVLRQRMAELQVLHEMSLQLNAQLETADLLQLVVEQAVALLGSEAGDIYLYDPHHNELVVSMATGYYSDYMGIRLKPGEGLAGRVFESRRSLVVDNYATWEGHAAIYKNDPRLKAVLGVPLFGNDGLLGVLNIGGGGRKAFFDEHDIWLGELFAAQVAVALESTHLHAQVQRRAREMDALNKAGQTISSTLDLQTVLDLIIAEIRSLVDAEAASVLLYDPTSDELVFAASAGPASTELIGTHLPTTAGIAGWVMREKQSVLVGDVRSDPRFYGRIDAKTGLTTRSLLAVPLIFKGVASGVIEAMNKASGTFDDSDLNVLEVMAVSAAIAIANAQLFEAEQQHTQELAEHAMRLEQRVEERTAEIRSQQARTQAILDALGEGVIVTDVNGTILYVNPALEALSGYPAGQVLGQSPRIWQSRQTPQEVYQAMWKEILAGGVWRGEIVNKRQDGSLYQASLTIAPIYAGNDDQTSGFVGVQHDITRLKELDRLKSEFVSNVSHELRTPLANIKLYLNLLERGKPEKRSQYVEVLGREELRLEHLIEGLLALSRMDLNKMNLQRTAVDVGALAMRLVADRETLATEKGLELICEAPPGDLPSISADEMMISQVLTNLLSNAMNYTPGGGTIVVRVATRQVEGQSWVTVAVEDNGVGMISEDMERLFERFYRGSAARQTGAQGTGLGLAICQEIIERHKGRVSAESNPGAGSTFTVWLPV